MSDPHHTGGEALRTRAGAIALLAALLTELVACQAPAPRTTAPDRAPPLGSQQPIDGSYDWHGLLIAPFGSVLKDVPLALHEVLLFRDETRGSAAPDDAECYAADAPAPRFVGRTPDEYLLCFKRDRLSRIQASVRLTSEQATEVFTAACAIWLKNTAPPPAAEIQSGAACDGRDGAVHYHGRLDEESVLSIVLDSVPEA